MAPRGVFFGKLGEIAGEYLRKGSQVYVEGELRYDKYTGQDGVEKYSTDIVANEMLMLGGRGEGGGGGMGGERPQRSQAPRQQQGGGGGQGGGGYGGGGQGLCAAASAAGPAAVGTADGRFRRRRYPVLRIASSLPHPAKARIARAFRVMGNSAPMSSDFSPGGDKSVAGVVRGLMARAVLAAP